MWARILGQLGIAITSDPGCHAPQVASGQITAILCGAFGHIGSQQIWLNAHSVVVATGTGYGSSSADFGAAGNGTQINVLDVGR